MGLAGWGLPCSYGPRAGGGQDFEACLDCLSGLAPGGFLEVSSLGGTILSLVPDFINTRVFGDDIGASTSHARLRS